LVLSKKQKENAKFYVTKDIAHEQSSLIAAE
jgi:hypothetical protein